MEMLELVAAFMRDIMLLQRGCLEVVNGDLLPILQREAVHCSPQMIMERIQQVYEARQAILRNVNPRLALEVLFMRLAEQ